jgi:hypothetical protein
MAHPKTATPTPKTTGAGGDAAEGVFGAGPT